MKIRLTVLELLNAHRWTHTHTHSAGHMRIFYGYRYERATNTDIHPRPRPFRTHRYLRNALPYTSHSIRTRWALRTSIMATIILCCFPQAWNFIYHITERTQRRWECGRTSCVPRCLVRVYQLLPESSVPRLRKYILVASQGLCFMCTYKYTTKSLRFAPPEQISKRTRNATRTPHTHTHTHTHTQIQRHHPASKISTFATTMCTRNAWHFAVCLICLDNTLNV
jgi:hypothetical protein